MKSHRHVAKRTTDWVELGIVSTNTATLAIVNPAFAFKLAEKWSEYLDGKLMERTVESSPNFDQWRLEGELVCSDGRVIHDEDRALVFQTSDNGGWAVEGRFGPSYVDEGEPYDDDEPVRLVELRIRLADIDECDCDRCGWDDDR